MSRFDNPTVALRLMRVPAWPLLSASDQHECLKLLADRRGLSFMMRANDGRWWIGLPNRPVLDSEGRHLVVDGKKAYAPTIDFRNRATRDWFTAGVLRAVQQ